MPETWTLLLQAARTSEPRDPLFSEDCLRRALRAAETTWGLDSAEAGLCLLELADFLERSGRLDESETVCSQYRAILCKYARQLGLDKAPPGH